MRTGPKVRQRCHNYIMHGATVTLSDKFLWLYNCVIRMYVRMCGGHAPGSGCTHTHTHTLALCRVRTEPICHQITTPKIKV